MDESGEEFEIGVTHKGTNHSSQTLSSFAFSGCTANCKLMDHIEGDLVEVYHQRVRETIKRKADPGPNISCTSSGSVLDHHLGRLFKE